MIFASNLDAVADVAIQEVAAAGGTGIELNARAGVHVDSEGLGGRGGLWRTLVVKGAGKPLYRGWGGSRRIRNTVSKPGWEGLMR